MLTEWSDSGGWGEVNGRMREWRSGGRGGKGRRERVGGREENVEENVGGERGGVRKGEDREMRSE